MKSKVAAKSESVLVSLEDLRAIQWILTNYDDETDAYYKCPACHRYDFEGHRDGCWIKEALTRRN